VIILEVVLIQLSSWGWARSCSKHADDSNKHIIDEIEGQVGHLPELYEDARSGEKNPEQSFRLDLPCVGIRIQGRPNTIAIEQETSWAPAPVLKFQKT
jgi:hypothetical protein